ncbi:MAG TPA: hypothetical protein VIL98_10220 [Gaiellaceae bacterium]
MNTSALNTWREIATKRRLTAALVAGVVATHIATVTGYWYAIVGLPKLDYNLFNGILLVPNEKNATIQFVIGGAAHYLTGICYALIFAFLIHPLLRVANSVAGNIAKAVGFGLVLATLSALLWVPRDFPSFNPGFFTNNFGWKFVLGIYVWHIVYGLHLGALYSPLPASAAEPAAVRSAAPAATQPV